MRLQYKILIFLILQLLIVLTVLNIVTARINQNSLTQTLRETLLGEFQDFTSASGQYFAKDDDKGLLRAARTLAGNPYVKYLALQDVSGRALLVRFQDPSDQLLAAKPVLARNAPRIVFQGLGKRSMYDLKNRPYTEMWTGVEFKGLLRGYIKVGVDERKMDQFAQSYTNQAFGRVASFNLYLVLASFLATFLFTRWIDQPLKKFQEKIEEILSRNRYLVPGSRPGMKLEEVADSLERAADEISYQKEARLNLVGTLGHELKSPLGSIVINGDYLKSGLAGPLTPKMKSVLETLSESAHRLDGMFNEMIEFARLDRRQVQVSIEKTDVVPLLRMAAEELRLAGEAGGIHLSAQEDRVPEVWCDSSKIRQILHNLVANALKFTPSGGSIRLFARTLSEVEVMVGVSDTGIGIPQDELPKIFERFHQVPGRLPLRKAEGGTGLGLGLSICRSLVELQKGRIWAESPAGGGSNIFFTLPSAEGNP